MNGSLARTSGSHDTALALMVTMTSAIVSRLFLAKLEEAPYGIPTNTGESPMNFMPAR
jgi:hypothetical protein